MTQVQQPKNLTAWIGPIVAFVLLVSGGWFLVWFWHGIDTSGTITLSPETTAALMGSTPARRVAATTIPPLQIPGKGSIVQLSFGNSWNVNAEPFQMHIEQIAGASGYNYRFMVRRDAAFSSQDKPLIALTVQLMFNPMVQRQAGASPELVQKLRETFKRDLLTPPLKIADADAQPLEALWPQYVSNESLRSAIGNKMLDMLTDAGNKSLSENQPQFEGMVKTLRTLIPADTEAMFRTNIHNATVRPLTESHPASQP